ncbi:MAG: PAS domain S-box protein, partial [Oscillospiraceae bacterium]|nr:PAS domain S-box protein [Oscillospiraceae bacterium]
MTGKIFRAILYTSVTAVCTSMLITAGCLYLFFSDIQKNQSEADIAGKYLADEANHSNVIMLVGIVAVVITVTAVILAVAAKVMAKRIVKPINAINPDYPLDSSTYDELAPLTNRIHQQNRRINHKINELKQKKDEFTLITKSMKEGLILLDAEKRILSINPAAMELTDSGQECIGSDFLKIERRQDVNIAVERAFGIGHGEIRTVKNEREYQYIISRIENNGTTVGAVVLAFDVTEQANAERMRREFSANVSHELKTP